MKLLEECEDEPSEALQGFQPQHPVFTLIDSFIFIDLLGCLSVDLFIAGRYVLPELLFADAIAAGGGAAAEGARRPASRLSIRGLLAELEKKDDAFWQVGSGTTP